MIRNNYHTNDIKAWNIKKNIPIKYIKFKKKSDKNETDERKDSK